jgi:hypothetical protein
MGLRLKIIKKASNFLIRLTGLGIGLGAIILAQIRCHIDKVNGWNGVTVFFNNYGEGPLEYYFVLPLYIFIITIAIILTFLREKQEVNE